jgi:sarcosine oxidase
MRRDYEYIVLGLGGWGSAAAYWLSRRAGADVLGLEQFEIGHVRGESQDHSRIIRLSYHTPEYVELAKHAYTAWREVERDSGEQLVLRTGGLDFAPRESAIPLTNYSGSMDAAGVPYEHLDTASSSRRAGSRWRRGATPRTSAWPGRTAPRSATRRRSSGSGRPGARWRWWRAASPTAAGSW